MVFSPFRGVHSPERLPRALTETSTLTQATLVMKGTNTCMPSTAQSVRHEVKILSVQNRLTSVAHEVLNSLPSYSLPRLQLRGSCRSQATYQGGQKGARSATCCPRVGRAGPSAEHREVLQLPFPTQSSSERNPEG